jgi:ATP-dependent Clp protease ATP-binding subunit ClpB
MNKIVEGGDKENLMDECKKDVLTILKKSVRPEFINRIDEIIMFEPLTKEAIHGILDIQLREVKSKLSENGVEISFTTNFVDYLAEKGFDPAYGARPIKRLLQRELINRLATEMLKGTISKEDKITVDIHNGDLIIK